MHYRTTYGLYDNGLATAIIVVVRVDFDAGRSFIYTNRGRSDGSWMDLD